MLEAIDVKWVFTAIAICISTSSMVLYVLSIIKGETKPHMYTWFIWGLVTLVVTASQYTGGAGAAILFSITVIFNCFLIATLSFFKGNKSITLSDNLCLLFCIIAILLWPLTKIPLWSLLIVTVIDMVGYIATIRKSFQAPHQENLICFFLFGLNWTFATLAIENYNMLTAFYPICMIIFSFGLVGYLIIRRHQLNYKILT